MLWTNFVQTVEAAMRAQHLDPASVEVDELDVTGGTVIEATDLVIRLDPADGEPDVVELCIWDKHAREKAVPTSKPTLRFVRRSSKTFGVQGPADQLTIGAVVDVTKRNGEISTVRITGIAKTLPGDEVVAAFDNHEDPWHKRTSNRRRV